MSQQRGTGGRASGSRRAAGRGLGWTAPGSVDLSRVLDLGLGRQTGSKAGPAPGLHEMEAARRGFADAARTECDLRFPELSPLREHIGRLRSARTDEELASLGPESMHTREAVIDGLLRLAGEDRSSGLSLVLLVADVLNDPSRLEASRQWVDGKYPEAAQEIRPGLDVLVEYGDVLRRHVGAQITIPVEGVRYD
jgi:hypothetical protein